MILLWLSLRACAPGTVDAAGSPHGSERSCTACHDKADGTGFVGGSEVTACMSCHEEGSPHDQPVAPTRATVPAGFPLVNGLLSCGTCHDEPACEGEALDPKNDHFFRGGPYEQIGGLCAQCHLETAVDRFDPHEELRTKTGEDLDEACLLCHDELPEPGGEMLRLPGAEICRGCHFETVHAGSVEHMVVMEPERAEVARQAGLPIGPDHKVSCLTCHDPHPSGSIASNAERLGWVHDPLLRSDWDAQILSPTLQARNEHAVPLREAGDLMRLPLSDGSLCRACHGAGPRSRE